MKKSAGQTRVGSIRIWEFGRWGYALGCAGVVRGVACGCALSWAEAPPKSSSQNGTKVEGDQGGLRMIKGD